MSNNQSMLPSAPKRESDPDAYLPDGRPSFIPDTPINSDLPSLYGQKVFTIFASECKFPFVFAKKEFDHFHHSYETADTHLRADWRNSRHETPDQRSQRIARAKLTHHWSPIQLSLAPYAAMWHPKKIKLNKPYRLMNQFNGPAYVNPARPPLDKKTGQWFSQFIKPQVDLVAFGWNDASGRKPQVSRDALTKHYDALWGMYCNRRGDGSATFNAADILAPLSAKQIKDAGAGNIVIRVRSRFTPSQVNHCLVRVDLDTHHGETDLDAAQAMVNELLQDLVTPFWYDATLGRGGRSGFFRLVIPLRESRNLKTFEPTGMMVPVMGRREANQFILKVNKSFAAIAKQCGITTGVEFKGGFLMTQQARDKETGEPLDVRWVAEHALDGQFMCNLPDVSAIKTVADQHAFEEKKVLINHPRWKQFFQLGEQAQHFLDSAKKAKLAELENLLAMENDDGEDLDDPTPAKPARPYQPRAKPLSENRQAIRSRYVCIAIHQLHIHTKHELLDKEAAVIESAKRLYRKDGIGDASNPQKWQEAFNYVAKSFKASRIGRRAKAPSISTSASPASNIAHGNHSRENGFFTDADIHQAERELDTDEIRILLEQVNLKLRAHKHSIVTRELLAVALVTFAKNSVLDKAGNWRTETQAFPTGRDAPLGMVKYHGISCDECTIAAAVKILRTLGKLELVKEYKLGSIDPINGTRELGKCRTWNMPDTQRFRFIPDHATWSHTRMLERRNRERQQHLAERREAHGMRENGRPATVRPAQTDSVAGNNRHPFSLSLMKIQYIRDTNTDIEPNESQFAKNHANLVEMVEFDPELY